MAYRSSTHWDSTSTPTSGHWSRTTRAARSPSSVKVGGIRTSTTTASGRVRGHRAQELLAVALGGGHLVPGLGEQPGQPLPQQHGVLGDHYPHGSSAAMIVGPPDGDSTESRPSTPDTRSASPDRPGPCGSAPPIPSSLIMTVSVPG